MMSPQSSLTHRPPSQINHKLFLGLFSIYLFHEKVTVTYEVFCRLKIIDDSTRLDTTKNIIDYLLYVNTQESPVITRHHPQTAWVVCFDYLFYEKGVTIIVRL